MVLIKEIYASNSFQLLSDCLGCCQGGVSVDKRPRWIASNFPFTLGILIFSFKSMRNVCTGPVWSVYWARHSPDTKHRALHQTPQPASETSSPPIPLTVIWRDAPWESWGASGVCGRIAMLNVRLSRWVWASVALETWRNILLVNVRWVEHVCVCLPSPSPKSSVSEFCLLLYHNSVHNHFRQFQKCRKM